MRNHDSLNLTAERGPSVWDRASLRPGADPHEGERVVVAVLATTLVAIGGSRRSWRGALLAGLAGVVAVRATLGHNDLRNAAAWLERSRRTWLGPSPDVVENASEGSFPASDPPAWTGSAVQAG